MMHFLKLSTKIIIIQRAARNKLVNTYNNLHGPAYIKRHLCVNDTDFFTLEEINDIPNTQFLSYNIYLVDSNNDKTLTYTDTHFGSDGVLHLEDTAFPGPLASYSLTTFTQDNTKWYSESIDAQPAINGNEALHSAAVYTDSYIGDVTVQGTLENQVTGSTNWVDITTLTFTGSETEPKPVNFNGVFGHLRVSASANPADKITQILVRN